MSVLVTVRVSVDTAKFREALVSRADDLRGIADDARGHGCLHHRFGVGDGYVIASDEWESAEGFQGFFSTNQVIPELLREVDVSGEPEITITEAVSSPDEF